MALTTSRSEIQRAEVPYRSQAVSVGRPRRLRLVDDAAAPSGGDARARALALGDARSAKAKDGDDLGLATAAALDLEAPADLTPPDLEAHEEAAPDMIAHDLTAPDMVARGLPELAHPLAPHAAALAPSDGAALSGRDGPLTVDEEHELSGRWQSEQDESALGRLIQAHLGLVIRIALEFRHSGPPMEDLIQEGNLGLTIAARRFDPTRATRLATYATYWIRACMLEHVVRSHGPVRIGTTRSQRKIFFGLGRARRRLEREGEAADSDSLASVLGVEREDVEAMAPRLTGHDVSLDAPRGVDDRREVGALLAEDGPSPEDVVARMEEDDSRRHQLLEGLKVLDPRERAIIKARHLRQRPATLASLGKKFGISRERVRQLELRAKSKLRVFCGIGPDAPPLESYL